MCPGHKSQAIIVIESFRDILPKRIACPPRTDTPSTSIIRIAPKQITHWPFVWYLLNPIQRSYVVECINAGRKTSVQAEYLVIDQRCQGEVVEEVGEKLPYVGIAILAETFVVEAIHLSDLARFVIAAKNSDSLGIPDLESNEECDCFDWVITSINIVACVHVCKRKDNQNMKSIFSPMKR